MTFVNELIPEAEKEKFTFPVVTDPDGFKPTLWKWTIDREREAFLGFTRSEGGGTKVPSLHGIAFLVGKANSSILLPTPYWVVVWTQVK